MDREERFRHVVADRDVAGFFLLAQEMTADRMIQALRSESSRRKDLSRLLALVRQLEERHPETKESMGVFFSSEDRQRLEAFSEFPRPNYGRPEDRPRGRIPEIAIFQQIVG